MQTRSLYLAAAVLGITAGIGIPAGFGLPDRAPIPATSDLPLGPAPSPTSPAGSASPPVAMSPEPPVPTPPPLSAGGAARPVTATAPVGPPKLRPPARPAGGSTPEERGATALALIDYPWAATGYRIVFSGPRPDLLGLARGDIRQIEVFVRTDQSIPEIARVIGHELGHAVDFTMTTESERAAYRRIRGLDDRPWFPDCRTCADSASPAGDWAETFAYALLGAGPFGSVLAPPPSSAQLEALRPLFAPSDPAPVAPSNSPSTTTTTTTGPAPAPTTAPPVEPRPNPGHPRQTPGLLQRLLGS